MVKKTQGCQEKLLDNPVFVVYDSEGDTDGRDSTSDIIV